jgi:hypothetical protein
MWWRWDSSCKRFANPNKAISRGIKGIANHSKVAILGCCSFPMLPLFTFFPYLFILTYLQDYRFVLGQ